MSVYTRLHRDVNGKDGYTAQGKINWPKMIMYIITGLIVLGRLLGVISNEDVMTLIDTLKTV